MECLPVPRADERADRVGVPARVPAVGHHDDDRLSGGQVADAQKVELAEILVAAVEHVEDGIGASAGAVIVGKQDVDAGIPADRGGLEPVVPQARVVLVAVHDRQAEPVAAPDEYDQYLPDVDDVGIGDAVDGGDQRIKRGVTIETHSQRRQRVPGDNRVSRDVRDDQPLPHIDDVGIGDPAGAGDQPIQFRVTIKAQRQRRQRVPRDNRVSREVGEDQPLPHIDDVGIGDPAGGGDQPIQFRVTIEAQRQCRQRFPRDNRMCSDHSFHSFSCNWL